MTIRINTTVAKVYRHLVNNGPPNSLREIGEKLDLSVMSIARSVADLEDQGIIAVERQDHSRHPIIPSSIKVLMDPKTLLEQLEEGPESIVWSLVDGNLD